jgi:hypothetical protein
MNGTISTEDMFRIEEERKLKQSQATKKTDSQINPEKKQQSNLFSQINSEKKTQSNPFSQVNPDKKTPSEPNSFFKSPTKPSGNKPSSKLLTDTFNDNPQFLIDPWSLNVSYSQPSATPQGTNGTAQQRPNPWMNNPNAVQHQGSFPKDSKPQNIFTNRYNGIDEGEKKNSEEN